MYVNRKTILFTATILLLVATLLLIAVHLLKQHEGKIYNRKEKYIAEQNRFSQVLQNASDDELFIVLKYAIAHRYVPNSALDPYYDMYVMARPWKRSLKVYDKLSTRQDLLIQIYPDLETLDNYIKWRGAPYPDTLVSQSILNNVDKDIKQVDSIMGKYEDHNSLEYKYFATPLLKY